MFDYMDIKGLTTREELELVQQQAKLAIKRLPRGSVVELGAFQGRATVALCQVAGDGVISIDNFVMQHHGENNEHKLRQNCREAGVDPEIVRRVSHFVPEQVTSVAFLLIDTDHRAAALNRELDAWLPLMSVGSCICLHDYNCEKWPEVTDVADTRLIAPLWARAGIVGLMATFVRVQ
jgi:cephalosporin hydroxylase